MKTVASSSLALFLIAFCGASLNLSCGNGAGDRTADAARTEWSALERERSALDELRSQLAEARAEQPPIPSRVEELESRVGAATDRFLERLVAFINQHAGAPRTDAPPEVKAAIQAKSAEDLLLARGHIEGAGDYVKAIDILAAARVIDPDNPELAAAQAEAERLRFVDGESFGRIEKGMTEDEVRAELGQVKPQNVRPSPDGQVAWLYPREGGAAAAVFFHPGANGALEVYDTNFEAIPSGAERAAGETGP